MDNFDSTNQFGDNLPSEETELSHTDKMIGVLTEPASTFSKIVQFPLKTVDWILPLLILLLLVGTTSIIKMSNPEIKMAVQEKQMADAQKNFDEAVAKGQMTREQADEQMERIREMQNNMGMGVVIVFSIVGSLVIGFIMFFLMCLIYFIAARFILKDQGTYVSSMIANGLVSYIIILQFVLSTILSLAMGKMVMDTSVASLLDSDRVSYLGWFLGKLDPIIIWANAVIAIGLAKLFRSESTTKYYALVFGIWIVGGFIFFMIARAVPFLRPMMGM